MLTSDGEAMTSSLAPQQPSYMPKGSMCAACAAAKYNCASLPFQDMPVIGEYWGVKIVRCTLFRPAEARPARD